MNPEPCVSAPPAAPHRRSRIVQLCLATIAILFASFLLVLFPTRPLSQSVIWLTPAERDRLTLPGPLTRAKWTLMNWTAPLLHRLWSAQPNVYVESHLLALPPNTAELAALPAALSTNLNGARAWILSPPDFKAFQERVKQLPGASELSSPRIQTGNESQAQLAMVNNILIAGKPVPAGITINLTPKIIHNSVRIVVAATSTIAPDLTDPNSLPAIRTNLNLLAQAWISNRCGLVVDGGKARDDKGNRYWFILAPTIVDSNGNPRP